jgi:uncharacterized protein
MSKDYLPTQVNPLRFAENATQLHGHLFIKDMQRLTPSLFKSEGEVEVRLQFGIDERGIRFLKGLAIAQLTLQCQRCMEAFVRDISGDFIYAMVSDEEKAKRLPKRYDPVFVIDDTLNIQDIVEEELIINLPIVPMHCSEDCKIQLPITVASEPSATQEMDHPFKVIELLKVRNKDE